MTWQCVYCRQFNPDDQSIQITESEWDGKKESLSISAVIQCPNCMDFNELHKEIRVSVKKGIKCIKCGASRWKFSSFRVKEAFQKKGLPKILEIFAVLECKKCNTKTKQLKQTFLEKLKTLTKIGLDGISFGTTEST